MSTDTIFKRDEYSTRKERLKNINRPSSIWLNAKMAIGVTLFCILADTYFLYSKWYTVISEAPAYVIIAALVCALALDWPLAYYGIVLKKYQSGLETIKRERIMRYLAIGVFLATFVISFYFSMVTKDLVFEVDGQETMEDTVEQENQELQEESHEGVTVAAIFNGMLPLLTSITSFMITFSTYTPINDTRMKYEKARIEMQNNLMDVERALAEADPEHFDRLFARETSKYQAEKDLLRKENAYLKELARAILERQMTTEEENDEIARNGKKILTEQGFAEQL